MANRENRESGYRLMDKQWEEVQKKTFTKWCNSHLVKRFGSNAAMANLEVDFESGIKLMELVNCLYNVPFPQKYNKAPKMRPHQLDNIQMALAMLEHAGVKTNFLKTTHLADRDKTMLLGMVWSIILDYQIKGINVEEVGAKEGLLLWCKRKTAGYKDVQVTNFTDSWQDGLAFCALIHKHRPDLINFDQLSKDNPRENLELAFDVAEKHLGIARLLDVEDIAEVVKPDERSIVTYVSEYFHCFTSQDQTGVAGRRLSKWLDFAKTTESLKSDYLEKAEKLIKWIQSSNSEMQDRKYDGTLVGIERKWEDFKKYKKNTKPAKTNERLDVESAYNTLQALLRVNNRPEFVPPEEFSLGAIDRNWNKLSDEETKRADWIRREIERQRKLEILASRFWRKAKALLVWGDDNNSLLRSGDCGHSIAAVEAKLKNHEGWENVYQYNVKRLSETKNLGHDLINHGYGRSAEVTAKISELDSMWASLKNASDSRKAALQAELEKQRKLEQMQLDFATRARAFVTWIEDAEDGEIAEPFNATSLEGVEQLQNSLGEFLQDYTTQTLEYNKLMDYSNTLVQEGISENPFSSFSMEQITERWNRLQAEITERQQGIDSERQRIQENDQLVQQFADHAKQFLEWVDTEKELLSKGSSGKLQEQLAALQRKSTEISGHKSKLVNLTNLNNQIEERNITHNPYTEETIETLTLAYENLNTTLAQQQRLLEKEIINQSGSKVSQEQLNEFKETFRNFDRDNSGTLERNEFEACLKALGQWTTPEEVDRLVSSLGKAVPGKINFQEFVDYMISKTADMDTPEAIKNAFKTIAHDKPFITEDDLRRVPGITEDALKFLVKSMPKEGGGLNYNKFTESQYKF